MSSEGIESITDYLKKIEAYKDKSIIYFQTSAIWLLTSVGYGKNTETASLDDEALVDANSVTQ